MSKSIKSYAQQLVARKGDGAVFGLQMLLDDEKALTRKYAVQALGQLSWSNVETLIRNALSDPAASVRKEAVSLLAAHGGEAVLEDIQFVAHNPAEAKSVASTARVALQKLERNHQVSDSEGNAISVYEFNRSINELVSFEHVRVEGEVSGVQTSSFGSHQWLFFDLKDEEKEAKVRCMSTVFVLRKSQISLVDGMRVIVNGKPRLSVKSGRFGISVNTIELSGEGELLKAFELLKKKLDAEGLFQPERKRALPRFPQHIGLITSQDAAAYRDFNKVLNARMGGLDISFTHVQVQGQSAVNEIMDALQMLQTYPLDAIVITRGGGSIDDLHAFNSEEVARTIYGSDVPVVCGVGHERDETIAGFVADVRASTPSNAAELLVPDARELEARVDRSVEGMHRALKTRERETRQRLESARSIMEGYFQRTRQRVEHRTRTLGTYMNMYQQKTDELQRRVTDHQTRLRHTTRHLVNTYKERVDAHTRLLYSFDHRENLKRGYSITRKNGKIVRKATQLQAGDALETELADGYIETEVQTIHETDESPRTAK